MVRGLECPFLKQEEEEDDDDEEDTPDPKDRVPVAFPQVERKEEPGIAVPARRGPGRLIQQALDAVAAVEAEKALERIGEIQDEGGLQSVPGMNQLRGALTGETAQAILAVLTALAVTAALARTPGMRLATPLLAVASSERRVSKQFSMLNVRPDRVQTELDRRKVRELFGFGPVAGVDTFSETGFN